MASPQHEAARAKAVKGLRVFPVHTPRLDSKGQLCGCSCNKPDCKDIGKHPRTKNGVKDATTDLAQIDTWWTRWPDANIGVATGRGLVVLDADTYKSEYQPARGGLDFLALCKASGTRRSQTGGGGTQYFFKYDASRLTITNTNCTLPKGWDVRGEGGYVVIAPSLHKSGKRYTDNCAAVQPCPPAILDMLVCAQQRAGLTPHTVTFGADVKAPDLSSLYLSQSVLDLIANPKPKGQRSEADFTVICALVRAELGDDEIRAVFQTQPIGAQGRYAEKGDRDLARSIANARASVYRSAPAECPPPEGFTVKQVVGRAADWLRSADATNALREAGYTRVDGPRATLMALLDLAICAGALAFRPGLIAIARLANLSHGAARKHLLRLHAARLVEVVVGTDKMSEGLLVRLSFAVDVFKVTSASTTYKPTCEAWNFDNNYFAQHSRADAFTPYPASYAQKRRKDVVRQQGLNRNALLLWDAFLRHGPADVQALSDTTGLKAATVRATLRRMAACGLAEVVSVGAHNRQTWALVEHTDEQLAAVAPSFASYGLGALRRLRAAKDVALWAGNKERKAARAGDDQAAQAFGIRRERADERVRIWSGLLERMGINPNVRVRPARRPRRLLTRNRAEDLGEAVRLLRDWEAMEGDPIEIRVNRFLYAGYSN